MKILVALSGGIDSSVVAHLLAEQGHELIGVRFTLWTDPLAPAIAEILPSKCCNAQTAARALAVSKKLGIPYHIVDLQDEFKKQVVDPFLEGYAEGKTPNPCIRCNRTIKFGKLLELTQEFGCDMLATGHYARVARERLPDGSDRMLLLEAIDQPKDQSYYLYGLSQDQLKKVMFPLGAMCKTEVYALAEHFGVPYEKRSYRESQDLCFFPEKSPQEFLKRHLQEAITPGEIIRRDGTVVGSHEGLPLYTLGQRRGLKIGGLKIPLEVVGKDTTMNRLIVAPKGEEGVSQITVQELHWVSWKPEKNRATTFEYRTRSLSPKRTGSISFEGSTGRFQSDVKIEPQAPGQCLVLYRGEEVIGGGIIE